MPKRVKLPIVMLKAAERPRRLPKFKIKKPRMIVLPELPALRKRAYKYPLIEPFAFARIAWDRKRKELRYELIEPKLTAVERQAYNKILAGLLEVLEVELSAITKEAAMDVLEPAIRRVIESYGLVLSRRSYLRIMYYIYRNFVGLNEIEPLMHDPYVQDISCDGVGIPLYIVHRKYGSLRTSIIYSEAGALRQFVVKLAERCGRFISYAQPLLDGSLPDGSRVQATFARDVTIAGPTFTVRRFPVAPFSPIDLLDLKTVSPEVMAYLWLAVENGACILIGGGAITGKTVFLNALTAFVPPAAKIVSIEDTHELNIPHENWIPAVARRAFVKGVGEVTMFDLLKESFRQSPDYLIVGEIRGAEAYVMFTGMAAGIPAMGTMHAARFEDVMHRLQTPPINLSPTLVETLDLVLIMIRTPEISAAARRVRDVVEIESVDPKTGVARTNKVYSWIAAEDSFSYRGYSWLLDKIARLKGITPAEAAKELSRRAKVLTWMQKAGIRDFRAAAEIFGEYYKDKTRILREAKVK
jgi:flagellar protein FlaI